ASTGPSASTRRTGRRRATLALPGNSQRGICVVPGGPVCPSWPAMRAHVRLTAMPRPPVALKRRIAAELRALRERSGLTLEAAAQRAEVTKSSLSRFENGHSAPKIHTLRALMDLYNASEEQREELEQLTKEAARRGWSTSV